MPAPDVLDSIQETLSVMSLFFCLKKLKIIHKNWKNVLIIEKSSILFFQTCLNNSIKLHFQE